MVRLTFGARGHTILELLPKTQAVRFRDLISLRARVDDDEQSQPDFEMTVEMWERASWDEYEISPLSRTRDHGIEVWTEKESPWARGGSEHVPEICFTTTRRHSRMIERNQKRCCVQC